MKGDEHPVFTLVDSRVPFTFVFINHVAGAIMRLVASVCVCVRLPLALSCLNRLTFDLDFWHEGRP